MSPSDWPDLPTGAGLKQQKQTSHSRHPAKQPEAWSSRLHDQLEVHEHSWSGLRKQKQQSLSSEMPWTATKQESFERDHLVSGLPRAKVSKEPSQPHYEVSTFIPAYPHLSLVF